MKIFITILFFTFTLFSSSVNIENIYLDKSNTSLPKVKKILDSNQTTYKGGSELRFGITKYPLYLKIKVICPADILYLQAPRLEEVWLYDSNFKLIGKSGYYFNGNTLYPYFSITPKSDTYYLKIKTIHSSINFSIKTDTKDNFLKYDFKIKSIILLFFGIIMAFMIYAFFISISLKNRAYSLYALYLLAFLFQQFWYLGLSKMYLPIYYVKLLTISSSSQIALLIITWSLFTINFFYIQKNTKTYKIYTFFIAIAFIEMLFLPIFNSFGKAISMITGAIFVTYNILVGLQIYKTRKTKDVKYFTVAYMLTSVIYLLIILEVFGIIFSTRDYPYLLEVAIAIEAFILLFALLERYNNLRKQHIQISEVNHRIKNTLAQIKALIQEYRNDYDKLQTVIDAIVEAHSLLFYENEKMNINLKKFITNFLGFLKYATPNKWQINLDLEDINIDIKRGTDIGIIINEIVTNAFKYVNGANNILDIKLTQKNSQYELTIQDNGKGFDANIKNSGGIDYIKNITQYDLNGNLLIDTTNGTKYTIRWGI